MLCLHHVTEASRLIQIAVSAKACIIPFDTMTFGDWASLRLRVPTERIGEFNLSLTYTYVDDHTFQQYPGDPTIDKLAFDSGYYIPRDKGTASIS